MQIKRPPCSCPSQEGNFTQIYRHLYSVLFQILCVMDIFDEKNPESQENILLRIPELLDEAEGHESHVRERYFKKIYVVGVDLAIRSEH